MNKQCMLIKFLVTIRHKCLQEQLLLYELICNHYVLWGLYTLSVGKQLCQNSFLLFLSAFEKGSSLKGKNLLPLGANSFLLE